MVVQRTAKAKGVSTIAVYGRYNPCKLLALHRAFNSVFTVGSGAPFQVLFVVDVGSCEEGVISVRVSRVQGKVGR